jgi:hypothetical protein
MPVVIVGHLLSASMGFIQVTQVDAENGSLKVSSRDHPDQFVVVFDPGTMIDIILIFSASPGSAVIKAPPSP